MSEHAIEIEVEEDAWLRDLPDCEAIARASAEAALTAGEARVDAEVSILLAEDDEVAALNAQFRDKPQPTNVLSFPAMEMARPHLGDVILAHGVCAREAHDQGKPLRAHLSHLVAHGVLHLLGWDHQTDAEAEEMESLERTVLAKLGIPDPYATQDGTDERRRPE
ncbi:MAG: rRNA maturation RNase YbeY [Proteobacteria bacterium]|nr:rRNA maturation RNase YbeY [Pseudomonadota bacterium]